MSLLMDALRQAETQEQQEEPTGTDSVTEPAENTADLQLEPLNAVTELLEELQTETDAFINDTTAESADAGLPHNQTRPVTALAITPATAWQKKALYFLSGFVTIITITGGYYLWRDKKIVTPVTPHTATLINAPAPETLSRPAAGSKATKAIEAPLPVVPDPASSHQPDVTTARATGTSATTETNPIHRIEIHKNRKSRSVHPLVQKAYRAYRQQNYLEAEQFYRQAIKRYPDNRDAALGLAAIAMHQGNHQIARYYYKRVLKADPADKTAQIALNSLNNTQDNLQETSQLKYWLRGDRNNAQLHFALGNRYAASEQWKEAQQAYFEAQRIDSSQPDYAFNLAVSLDQLGLYKQALEYYLNARRRAVNHTALFSTQQLDNRIRQLEQRRGKTP